ncbi:hypothetical protein GX408_13775, partial [bacterium]|nr:hypothetical protein [bacterium]
IRKRELKKLFRFTAEAFDLTTPELSRLSCDELLSAYAAFTRSAADQLHSSPSAVDGVQQRLFQQAYAYGGQWRMRFRLSSMNEAMRAARVLYRAMGIDFRGVGDGLIEIRRCFFSAYYTSATCRILSALDAGIVAGLAQAGGLDFSQRITEGADMCLARCSVRESER